MSGLIHLLSSHGLPQDIILKATFYGIAGLTVLFAFFVVISRNIFHSALSLAAVLMGVACVYLYLDTEFLAAVQILIYVGAIMTLFIFTIMLTADLHKKMVWRINPRVLLSACAASIVLVILIKIINMNPWQPEIKGAAPIDLPQLGKSLMTNYVLPFEVISLISLAALVGAIVIGKTKRK